MKLIKTSFYILTCVALSACVFSQQLKDQKKNKDFKVIVDDESNQPENIFEEEILVEEVKIPTTSTKKVSTYIPNDTTVWYHPNPWWQITTTPFPVSKDSFEYRMFRPQYGATVITDTNNVRQAEVWTNWQIANKLYNNSEFGGHAWQTFIRTEKKIFEKHPEYLAEINGERVGFGRTSKLCVSNKNVQQLYAEYIKTLIKKFPERSVFSIEPSDGSNFCTCSNCKALGNTSDQVYTLANAISEIVSKSNPEVLLYMYAYNFHSEIPKFPLHKNLIVSVIPRGFQRIYEPEIMMKQWSNAGNHLIYRDYFGIPQWTADLPRINVPTLLERTRIARELNYKAVIMETGANINASILFVLMNAIWMNPDLSWDSVMDKFITDCFPSAPIPMKRLFLRWQNSDNRVDEIGASLYDLNEAKKSIKDPNELKRWYDIAAYVNYMDIYYRWSSNISNPNLTKQYFDQTYATGNRNIINSYALATMYKKHITSDSILQKKYIADKKPKNWTKQLSDTEILKKFNENINKYELYLNNYSFINPFELSLDLFKKTDFFTQVVINFKNIDHAFIVTNSNNLKISADYISNSESPLLVSVFDKDLNFVKNIFFDNKEVVNIKLPKEGVYKVTFHRAVRGTLQFEGNVIPILNKANVNTKLNQYYTLEKNGVWKNVNTNNFPLDRTPLYFQLNR